MFEKSKAGLLVVALLAAGTMARPVMAAAGDVETRQVVTLVDAAKVGKVTRQPYLMDVQYTRPAKSSAPHR